MHDAVDPQVLGAFVGAGGSLRAEYEAVGRTLMCGNRKVQQPEI